MVISIPFTKPTKTLHPIPKTLLANTGMPACKEYASIMLQSVIEYPTDRSIPPAIMT